jgi:hypothetical protein
MESSATESDSAHVLRYGTYGILPVVSDLSPSDASVATSRRVHGAFELLHMQEEAIAMSHIVLSREGWLCMRIRSCCRRVSEAMVRDGGEFWGNEDLLRGYGYGQAWPAINGM